MEEDDENALAGGTPSGSDDDEEEKPKEEDEEEEEEEEDDDDDDEEGMAPKDVEEDEGEEEDDTPSEFFVEYNRQYSHVPNRAVVRKHGPERALVVDTCEKLGEMSVSAQNSGGGAARWPLAESIDPASIVVLKGRIKEDDKSMHFVWYCRIVVKNRSDGDDVNILRHIPKQVCRELIAYMTKAENGLARSRLITEYAPTNNNEKVLVPYPKVNNWQLVLAPQLPKTIGIKPAGVGSKRVVADTPAAAPPAAAAPSKKSKTAGKAAVPAPAPAPAASKPVAPPKAAVPLKPKSAAEAKARGASTKPPNPFVAAKKGGGKAAASAAADPVVPVVSYDPTRVDEEVQAMQSVESTYDEPPARAPQDEMLDQPKMLKQFRGGPEEKSREGEARAQTLTWSKADSSGNGNVMQKLMIPEWAGSWKLSLQLSSETDASFS